MSPQIKYFCSPMQYPLQPAFYHQHQCCIPKAKPKAKPQAKREKPKAKHCKLQCCNPCMPWVVAEKKGRPEKVTICVNFRYRHTPNHCRMLTEDIAVHVYPSQTLGDVWQAAVQKLPKLGHFRVCDKVIITDRQGMSTTSVSSKGIVSGVYKEKCRHWVFVVDTGYCC